MQEVVEQKSQPSEIIQETVTDESSMMPPIIGEYTSPTDTCTHRQPDTLCAVHIQGPWYENARLTK